MPAPVREISDAERRARLAVRHGLGPGCAFSSIASATAGMTAWHATELPSVHLGIQARTRGLSVEDVDAALNLDRSLVKQLSMRRTLFAVDRALLPAVIAGPGQRVAGPEHRRLAKDLVAAGLVEDGEKWLAAAESEVLELLDARVLTTADVRAALPRIAGTVPVSIGTKWGQNVAIAPRVLGVLAAQGRVTRGANATHWRTSKPTWTTMRHWLGAEPELPDARAAYALLVGRWLRTFGPGTEEDIVWWFGATKTAVRAALADVGAVVVTVAQGGPAWLLPDDLAVVESPGPWAALLPTLDPTTMGWRGRAFYLNTDHTAYLFDSVGNAVPTVWVDGRIVGGWSQDPEGEVRIMLREKLPRHHLDLVEEARQRLIAFVDGDRVPSTYAVALLAGRRLP